MGWKILKNNAFYTQKQLQNFTLTKYFLDVYCLLFLFQAAVFISADCSSCGAWRITRCICYQTSDGTGSASRRKFGKSFPDLLSTGKFSPSLVNFTIPEILFLNIFDKFDALKKGVKFMMTFVKTSINYYL